MDIGTGTAVIPLLLCLNTPGLSITAVEIQGDLARIAAENVVMNHRTEQIRVLHRDIKEMQTRDYKGTLDMVVANPPYRKKAHGRINPHPQKAVARHELTLTLSELTTAASLFLKPAGTFCTIYPVNRLSELMESLTRTGLTAVSLRFIHPRKGENAKLFMVRARKNRQSEFSILPPLYLRSPKNQWSREMNLLFNA